MKVLQILLKFWRETAIVILIIAVCIATQTCSKHASNERVALSKNDSAYTVIKKHELKNGQYAYQVQTQLVTVEQLTKDLGLSKDSLKHLKSQVGSLSNLVAAWNGQIISTAKEVVQVHDTIYIANGVKETGKTFSYSNKYLKADGFMSYDSQILTFGYEYAVDFSLVAYRKKKSIADYLKLNFQPGPLVADVSFSDPNIKVSKIRGVAINEGKKPFYKTDVAKIIYGIIIGRFSKK